MGEIKLTNIKKSYATLEVLKDINLHIKDGEFIVFVGPSGCGKSTLLRTIAGLEKTTGGTLEIDGNIVNNVTAADRGLAMVFQSYALYPHMSVRQNLSFGLENSNMPKAEIKERIEEAARMLEIDAYMDRRPGQLSGGQRQRVAIGRAIVRRPTAFLLDEPLSNLDAELRVSTRAELAALHARLGSTMIYVTHDQVEAMTLAHRIVVMRAGKIEQVGTPLELYNQPANRFVAGFIGAPHMNFLKAEVLAISNNNVTIGFDGDYRAELNIEKADLTVGDLITIGVRPQHLEVSDNLDHPALKITLVEALGSETVVHGEIAGKKMLAVLPGQQQFSAGDLVRFDLTKPVLHVFDKNDQRIATHIGKN
ncbi:ABC transporter ATP-binding protein [Brucellaceae bacterium C25G]